MRPLLAWAIAALLVACAAPGGGGSTSGTAPKDFAFVLANPAGLLALDANGQVVGRVVDLPRDSAPSSPSLFPNGRSLVFSITLPPAGSTGFGSDIWAVDLDGTNLRRLVEHEGENVFYASPLVDPSGTALYFHRRAAIIQNGSYVGNEDNIERLDLTTKRRTRVVDKAQDPTLAPDGRTIVFVRVVDGQPQGLWRVGTDGANPGPFLTISDTWWYLQAPRFSPDGRLVIFSGAGHNAKSFRGGTRLAHLGIPSELFTAPPDGRSVRSIAQTGDDVVPAWSPDGAQVAFVARGALQIVTLADGAVWTVSKGDNFFFGDLVWVRK